jgi:hypothetical protein
MVENSFYAICIFQFYTQKTPSEREREGGRASRCKISNHRKIKIHIVIDLNKINQKINTKFMSPVNNSLQINHFLRYYKQFLNYSLFIWAVIYLLIFESVEQVFCSYI